MSILQAVRIQKIQISHPRTKSVQSRVEPGNHIDLDDRNSRYEVLTKNPNSFSKYFYSEEKEVQTQNFLKPSANNQVLINYDELFKSHRNSIEKEVMLIFNGKNSAQKSELSIQTEGLVPQRPEPPTESYQPKYEKLKDLLKLAKKLRPKTPKAGCSSPISISKAKIGHKIRVLPCNKSFAFKAKANFSRANTPKVQNRKYASLASEIVICQNSNKSGNLVKKDSTQRKRIALGNRSQTPVNTYFKMEFKGLCNKMTSPNAFQNAAFFKEL
ncbi:hypothetical protein SteCoe_8086 [Stentor coeruleus]|uniref:Uncharacterized protein n=1 Tax=Stentor coeruleus TaxID=5963 RepID=A0A1R2CL58_9CILI|nr:hypothetical protein SteCoe_8086 [Stentor coeruleus]